MSSRSDSSRGVSRPGPMPGRGRGMRGPAEKPKNLKWSLEQLFSHLKPYRWQLAVVIIFAIASTIFAIISPKILGEATNQIVDDYSAMRAYGGDPVGRPEFHFEAIREIVVLLVVLYLLSFAFSYIQGWIMTNITQKITYTLRRDISGKINRLPLSYFDKRTYGEILSRVTNDVDTISQTLNQSLFQIVTSVVMLFGIIAMMLSISWQLTLVAMIVLPISFGLIVFITKRSQVQFVRQQELLGDVNGHIEEMYAGHQVMRVFNGEAASVEKFTSINDQLHKSAWKAQFFSGLMYPITTFIGNLGFVGVAVVGGWQALNGQIKIGDIQAFIQYVQQFNQPIMQVANIASVIQSTAAAAERVFEFLNETEQPDDSGSPVDLKKVRGGVEFDAVTFGYDPEQPVINGLSVSVEPGSRVAIVGPTGAGKTTLVNLLMRFYDTSSGQIRIDGIDSREMKREDVRRMFGMVLQDAWLFNGSIRDNIMYGAPHASEKDMIRAAKEAHVDDFVRTLPGGYDMELNEEADNVSQGEKQLITIARAMLANAPMLILDEATSSVDTRTEALIQTAMDRLMGGKTSFVIAHRLSTIRNADVILVMNDGAVIEQGSHEALMKLDGFYARLYNSQFTQ